VVFGIATALTLAGFLLQYLMPGGRMARAGVRASSAAAGAALGIAGFFALLVVGAFVGFARGVYLAERSKLGSHAAAWPSTNQALQAIALSAASSSLPAWQLPPRGSPVWLRPLDRLRHR
jgi:hypothetical protein